MPEQCAPQPETPKPVNSLQGFISAVINECFDSRLLERQATLTKYNHQEYAPIQPDSFITLGGLLLQDGTIQLTFVGNVERILTGSEIELGAQVGDVCVIKRAAICEGAQIEPYTVLEYNSAVGCNALVSQGSKLFTQAEVGIGAIVGEGAEVSIDEKVADHEKVLPFTVHYG